MIISFDIGIKHLALCCMSAENKKDLNTYKIHFWDVYNTINDENYNCVAIQKGGKTCGKLCKYKYIENHLEIYCCKTHFPKNIKVDKNNIIKKKRIKDYLLQDIAKNVLNKLNEIYTENKFFFDKTTNILIELQPSLNPSMKLISHIIYGKLIEIYMNTNCNIKFVRASQKLKIAYDGPELICSLKGKYAQRKWLSIQYTKWFLENKFNEEQKERWITKFINSGTADEADTFCMCFNALFGLSKK